MAFTEAEFLKLQEEYYPSNKEQDNELSPEVETSPDPLSATQDGYEFEREAKLTGDEEDYKLDIINNKPVMASMRRYMYDRFGETGMQEDDETDIDFVDRYLNHHRYFTTNSVSLGKQVSFLRDAESATKQDLGRIYSHIENNAPMLWDQSLGDAGNTFLDYASAVVTDPLNVAQAALAGAFTGGTGAAAVVGAGQIIAKDKIKKALAMHVLGKSFSKHQIKGTVSHAALGAGQGALEDAMLQEMEMQAHVREVVDDDGNVEYIVDPNTKYEDMKTDMGRVGAAALFGGVLGGGEGFLMGRSAKKQALSFFETKLQIAGIDKAAYNEKLTIDAIFNDPAQGDVTGKISRGIDFDPETEEGKDLLEEINNLSPDMDVGEILGLDKKTGATKEDVSQATLRVDIARKMGMIARDIVAVKIKEFDDASKMGLEQTDDVLLKLIRNSALKAKEKRALGQQKKWGKGVEVPAASKDLIVDVFKYLGDTTNKGIDGVEEVDSLLEASGRRQDFIDFLSNVGEKQGEAGPVYDAVIEAFDTSLSNAGRTLNSASRMGKLLKEYGSFTKDQKKVLDEVFGDADGTLQTFESMYEAIHKFGRIRRALMTITPATTARNIFSGLTNITFATGANAIESAVYQTAKVISDKDHSFGRGLKEWWLDSSGMLLNMWTANRGAGRAMVDVALMNNPVLMRKLLRNNAEFGEGQNLPSMVNLLNGLNIASDGFFRRSLFAYELDKGFRRAGIEGGMKDVIMEGKSIPTAYLTKAAEETLKGTFSYSFKKDKGGFESTASTFIDFIEKVPGGTVLFPFARFMLNSMAFQYQYSPLNTAAQSFQAITTLTANRFRKDKKKLDYAGLSKAFSRGTVGTAALYAAVKMRADQQENPYWKLRIGDSDVDTRPLFPIAPYLLVADFIVKTAGMNEDEIKSSVRNAIRGEPVTAGSAPLGLREVAEGIAGLNMRATAQLPMFDAILGLAQKDETGGYFGTDKTGEALGEFMSSYLKTPFVGANFFKDVMASFDETEAVIRDTKAGVEGTGFQERLSSSFGESFKQVLPVRAQEALGFEASPVRQFAYREKPAYRQNTLAKQTTGARLELPPNDVQAEMEALGMPEWQRFKPSGDRVADSYMRKAHNQHMLGYIRGIMYSPEYQSMSKDMRSEFMNNTISVTKKEAKEIGEYFNMEAIVSRLSVQLPELEEEFLRMKDKNPKKAKELLLNYYQQKNYVYTGPFPRSRWMGSTAKRTKAVVNQHLKVMYNGMKDSGTLGDSEIGIIMTLAADKYGEDNLTIENTGLYALGHELGKVFKSGLKP